VASLIGLFAPITQAGWNPARDFGPRLVAYALGWGTIAIPGPSGGFWVYLVGPLLGGPIGGFVWEISCTRGLADPLKIAKGAAMPVDGTNTSK
jgi:glycerol uptake facilitator-like aquaporin